MRFCERGEAAPAHGNPVSGQQGGDRRSGRIETQTVFILSECEAKSAVTLSELQTRLAARGVRVGIGTLWRFFDRRRITLKKTAHAAEQERPDVAAARAAWIAEQPDLDPNRLVFIDG